MKRLFCLICLCAAMLLACAGREPVDTAASTDATPVPPPVLTLVPATAAATPVPTPTFTPEPTPVTITLGAVGDIMIVPKHVAAALDEETGEYDFSFCFPAVSAMFNAVDIMCGNLEGTLPGPEVDRYSSRQVGGYGSMRFGAPDAFAETLKDAGFNFLTTANNHAADYGVDGIVHTIDLLDEYGIHHTGTFKSAEARKEPCIIEAKGIRVGFVATTTVYNPSPGITDKQRNEMLSRTQLMELVLSDIAACREAGADFIVMFPHWDYEYKLKTADGTRNYARMFLEAGADAVIGSHPHVVQPMRYETVTRADGAEYTGFVAYSLGNFITNEGFEASCGLYVQLEITKDMDGKVSLTNACYLPTYCMDRYIDEKYYHQIIPALADTSGLNAFHGSLSEQEQKAVKRARDYISGMCGTEPVPLMEDACWKS